MWLFKIDADGDGKQLIYTNDGLTNNRKWLAIHRNYV